MKRQIGKPIDSSFYSQNLPLSGTVTKVNTPINSFPRKFTPDGNGFICFSQYTLELYRYEGCARAASLARHVREKLKEVKGRSKEEISRGQRDIFNTARSKIWSRVFSHDSTLTLSAMHNEAMNREFGVFVGNHFICASQSEVPQSEMTLNSVSLSNETLGRAQRQGPDHSRLENYTFYSVDYKSRVRGMVDEIKFKVDRIVLLYNQGVSVFGDNLAILSLHHQQIYLFKITVDGNFSKVTQIGLTLFPEDNELLRNGNIFWYKYK